VNDFLNYLCIFSPPSNAVGQDPMLLPLYNVMSVANECVRVSLFTRVLFYVSPTWLLLDRGPK